MDALDLRKKILDYHAGLLTAAEKTELLRRLDRLSVTEREELFPQAEWQALQPYAVTPEELRKRLGEIKKLSIDAESGFLNDKRHSITGNRPLRRIQLAAAAAVIGVLLFSGWWFRYRLTTSDVTAWERIANPSKGIKYVRLDDGTQVWLNAHSVLSYEKGFANKGRREIALEGEAFFDVAPDPIRPFAVNTRQLRTTVLGTSFNIRAWPSSAQTQIALVSGKVRITSSLTADSTVLLPGEVMNYDSGSRRSLVLEQAVREDVVEWVKGKIVLDNTPLPEILHQLEHIYNVSILFDADKLGSIRLSGQFRRDNIGDVLKNVLFPLDLDYSYDNGKYSIYKKKKE